jgi:multimeric flavodoxin WrbA
MLLEAALDGTRAEGLEDVDVVVRPALGATVSDVLAADGFVLGTPANIGYMSGALKHFFDGIYYPTLTAKTGAPYALYVHGNNDTTGAARAVESITQGLGWQRVATALEVVGAVGRQQTEAAWNLAATVAASLIR